MTKSHPHRHKDKSGREKNQANVSGNTEVRVRSEPETPPSPPEQQNTDSKEKKVSDKARFVVEVLTLVAVAIYAGLTAWQGCLTHQLVTIGNRTFEAANRPYIGPGGMAIEHAGLDKNGKLVTSPNPEPWAIDFAVTIMIKNYGTVPGTNLTNNSRLFIGGIEYPGVRIPDRPNILFPGASTRLQVEIGTTHYAAVMSGKETMYVQVMLGYDGPSGHYEYCARDQYSAYDEEFLDLGPVGCHS